MIQFDHVIKKFKQNKVLSDVSFEIEKGELVVLIGESGCGKTTAIKMINRLLRPTSGKVYIDGEDISAVDVIKLRRKMGYVIQQTGLFPHMTVRQNIGIIPKVEKKSSEEILSTILRLMEMVGLDPEEYIDRYPTELSGGQQQRVGVARAFATDPEIVLMDEPFSALDPITRAGLQDELINLQSQLKKTIVFVTHDMDEAIKIADKICIMNSGEILQYDTPENILKNPCNDFVSKFVGKNRIWASPEFIRASDIMIEDPVTCQSTMPLLKCMEKMRANQVDSLMVVDNRTKELLGIVGAKSIQSASDRTQTVGGFMERNFYYAKPDDSIIEILKTVDENNISTLPILSNEGALLGLITKSSLVTTLSQQYLDSDLEEAKVV